MWHNYPHCLSRWTFTFWSWRIRRKRPIKFCSTSWAREWQPLGCFCPTSTRISFCRTSRCPILGWYACKSSEGGCALVSVCLSSAWPAWRVDSGCVSYNNNIDYCYRCGNPRRRLCVLRPSPWTRPQARAGVGVRVSKVALRKIMSLWSTNTGTTATSAKTSSLRGYFTSFRGQRV